MMTAAIWSSHSFFRFPLTFWSWRKWRACRVVSRSSWKDDGQADGGGQPGGEIPRLLRSRPGRPVHAQGIADDDLADPVLGDEIAEERLVRLLGSAEVVGPEGLGGQPQKVADGQADMPVAVIDPKDPHPGSRSVSRRLRAWRSSASRMSSSTRPGKGRPLTPQSLGYMLISVKPGMVLISLM